MSKSKVKTQERRGFLKDLAVAGGVATAAGVVGSAAASEATEAQTEKPDTRGYKETAHVREYYRLARF